MFGDASVYPGTPIEFVPIWVAEVWRLGLFFVTIYNLTHLVKMIYARYGRLYFRAPSFKWFWMALVFTSLLLLVIQIERFDDQVVIEGLLSWTFLVIFVFLGIRAYRRENRVHSEQPRIDGESSRR